MPGHKRIQPRSDNLATLVALLRMSQLCEVVGLSRASIYNLINLGQFPAQRKLSANCVAWRADEVNEWIATRITEPTDAVSRLLNKLAA